jgi:hypothetical protein
MKLTVRQEAIRLEYKENTENIGMREDNLQYVHTPYWVREKDSDKWEPRLCEVMIDKLHEYVDLVDKKILVLNLEFAIVLIEQGVLPENITFLTDCIEKVEYAEFLGVNVMQKDLKEIIDGKRDLGQFNIVIGNPPYNMKTSGGYGKRDLWPDFVELAIDGLVAQNGYLVFVHPSRWRQPEDDLFLLFQKNNLIYLEIHDDNDGKKTFGATTRYDWYVLQNGEYNGETIIKDENGKNNVLDITKMFFIPNFHFDIIQNITQNGQEHLEIVFSCSDYETRNDWMQKEQDDVFSLPCVYSRYQDGSTKFWYSSEDKGMFGIPKVIVNVARYPYPMLDWEGQYGMCQNTFGIQIDSKEEGEQIVRAINTDLFQELLVATRWSNFQINWKMFKYFKKDFWKEFLEEDNEE